MILVIISIILVAVVVGVVVSHSRKHKNTSMDQPTSLHPTASPTEKPGRCEFYKIPFENFTDEVLATYDDIRDNFIPAIIPGFDSSVLIEEPCGAMDLAVSWYAYDVVRNGISFEDYSSQRFLLALLYTSLSGVDWDTTKYFQYLREGLECQWERVQCDDIGRVMSIDFRGIQGLSGTIPTEIGLLTSLSK